MTLYFLNKFIMVISQTFIYDLNKNLQKSFPAKYYRLVIDDLKNFTIMLPGAKLIMNEDYYKLIVNYESETPNTFNGRWRDQYLTYDFDQIKSFYEKNLVR